MSPNYGGIWWNSPANSESGWGLNLAHQGDTIFASWFTYDTSGNGWWLVATMNKTSPGTYSGDLYTTAGARFDAFDPAKVTPTKAGTATLTFADANSGTFNYVIGAVNQTKTITHQVFGTMPACTFGTVADLSSADQLPGSLVEQAGELRIGMGDQPEPPGRYDLRHLVHLRHERPAAMARGDSEQDKRRRLQRRSLSDLRRALQRLQPSECRLGQGGDGDVHVRRWQQRDVRLHGAARRA